LGPTLSEGVQAGDQKATYLNQRRPFLSLFTDGIDNRENPDQAGWSLLDREAGLLTSHLGVTTRPGNHSGLLRRRIIARERLAEYGRNSTDQIAQRRADKGDGRSADVVSTVAPTHRLTFPARQHRGISPLAPLE